MSVWDEDIVKEDDFIGECFIPLTSIESLKNHASIRDVPVSEVRLRRQDKNAQPRVYEVKFYCCCCVFFVINLLTLVDSKSCKI